MTGGNCQGRGDHRCQDRVALPSLAQDARRAVLYWYRWRWHQSQEKKKICPHCAAEISSKSLICEFCDHPVKVGFRTLSAPSTAEQNNGARINTKSLWVAGSLILVAAGAWWAVPNLPTTKTPAVETAQDVVLDQSVLSQDAAKGLYTTSLPTKLNQYTITKISQIGTRLQDGNNDVPESGDAVSYEDGGYGVSYDKIPGLEGARAGDTVKLQLITLPTQGDGTPCPPGDNRGSVYRATDLRTNKSWEAPDAEHGCGGA
jgi:hypothetical protein